MAAVKDEQSKETMILHDVAIEKNLKWSVIAQEYDWAAVSRRSHSPAYDKVEQHKN